MSAQTKLAEDMVEILIAEDSRTQAEQLEYYLERHHYRVTVAYDGQQALALVDQHKPALVISDIVMPGMDGFELCRRIKADQSTQDIPVILLTTLSNTEDVLEGLACGADNFITKPYSEEVLLLHIAQILASKRLCKNERVRVGVEILFGGKRRFITANQQQMLTLLISTYEAAVHRNAELVQVQNELSSLNERLEGLVEERTAALVAEIAERVRAEEERERLLVAAREQAQQVQQVQQIIHTVPDGIALLDTDLRIRMLNPVGRGYVEALTDARREGVLTHLGGRPLAELLSPAAVGVWHTLEVEGPPSQVFELTARQVGGEAERGGWVLVLRDVTAERRIEEQMRQQDRLAAIGQLAGGVAHDFNNLLTAIQGYTELTRSGIASEDPEDWPSGEEIRADLDEVHRAAERAAGLTRQLLAFSRRQVLQPQVLDLNAVIDGFEKMLRRLLGEDIELVAFLAPELGRVEADPGQIEQVIMNLAVNARDAMPGGGQLTIETANVTLDEVYARAHVGVEPGSYVMLAVSDTGAGMSEEVKAHVFEPFFTTKEKGKGTGLGLSTVYGIVKQSGGHVNVYSEPGVGTTFKVYLPRLAKAAEVAERAQASRVRLGGTETVLVAEDEEAVRALACRVLRERGYTVLEAGHPEDALRLASEHTGRIDLLLTDVVMPGMSGRELAERLWPSRPETAVLYISGYTDNAIVHHGVLDAGTPFLQKPFTPVALARKVREVLDASLPGELVETTQADLDVQSLRAGDETPKVPASETAETVSLTHESVAGLPADLVAAMREATINADMDALNELIDRVEIYDAQVAVGLRALAGRYRYDTLLDLFDAGEGEP